MRIIPTPLIPNQQPQAIGASQSILSTPALSGTSPSTNKIAETDKAFQELFEESDPLAILTDITANGIESMWAWQIKQMKQKIAGQALGEMGLTVDQVRQMPTDKRIEVEQQILKIVEERIKQMMAEHMNEKKKNPFGPIMGFEGDDAMPGAGMMMDVNI